ncbi:MAG: serine/threonine-protein kinase [Candidatus Eremiobacterota bacterium]
MADIIPDSRYEIIKELGRGGTGIVLLCYDSSEKREVAIKILSDSDVPENDLKRFQREALLISRLHHPNIVSFYRFVQREKGSYIVMEYVNGVMLKEYLNLSPSPIDCLLKSSVQICSALSHAHSKGIVHRDIKPANILVSPEGIVKITDFGVAKDLLNNLPRITLNGSLIGTLTYMSPEQILGQDITPLSDLYSLGVTLYELSTGSPPFKEESFAALLMQQSTVIPASPRELNPEISENLQNIIMKLLEKAPEKRYPSALALREALNTVIMEERTKISPVKTTNREETDIIFKNLEGKRLFHLAKTFRINGEIEKSLDCLKKSIELFREIKNFNSVLQTLLEIEDLYRNRLNNINKAMDILKQAIKEAEKARDFASMAFLYGRLGEDIYEHTCCEEESKYYLEKSLSLQKNPTSSSAKILSILGTIYLNEGNLEESEQFFRKLLTISEEKGLKTGEVKAHTGMGKIHLLTDKLISAAEHFRACIVDDMTLKAEGLSGLVDTLIKMDMIKESNIYVKELLILSQQIQEKVPGGIIFRTLGKYYTKTGQKEKGGEYLYKSVKLLENTKSSYEIAESLFELGNFYLEHFLNNKSKDPEVKEKAVKNIEKAKLLFTCLNNTGKVEELNNMIRKMGSEA